MLPLAKNHQLAKTLLLAVGIAAVPSCSSLPSRAFLRYSAVDKEVRDWQPVGAGAGTATGTGTTTPTGQHSPRRWTTTALGVTFEVDLDANGTRIQVSGQNRSGRSIEVAVGSESTRGSDIAVGELQKRPVDRLAAEGVPDFAPYRSLERTEVPAAWRAEFFLDSPLGREPTVGQYIVLVLEVWRGEEFARRRLPLIATNRG